MDWNRNDEICSAVIFCRPIPRHRDVIQIVDSSLANVPQRDLQREAINKPEAYEKWHEQRAVNPIRVDHPSKPSIIDRLNYEPRTVIVHVQETDAYPKPYDIVDLNPSWSNAPNPERSRNPD